MSERRQVARRESIELEAQGIVFVAEALPWLTSNDLGNEILQQNADATNNAVKLYVDSDNVPQLELAFKRKITDWYSVLKICYPKNKPEDFQNLDIYECAELVIASLELNGLEYLKHLVDPNSPAPMPLGGNEPSGTTTELGPKIASIPDSSSGDSVETPS